MYAIENPSQPNGKKYRVRASAPFEWRAFDTVRLEISVGAPYHEGTKVKAIIDWAHRNFSHTVIILGDTLQRHNLMVEYSLSESEARSICKRAGDNWIARHATYVQGCKLIRWNAALQSDDFFSRRWQIGRFYRTNLEFQRMTDQAIREIAARRGYAGDVLDVFYRSALNYLMEEAAGDSIIYDANHGVSAYPGGLPELWQFFWNKNIYGTPSGLNNGHCVSLHLLKK